MSKSDMERAREVMTALHVDDFSPESNANDIASLIQEVRNETLEAVDAGLVRREEFYKNQARDKKYKRQAMFPMACANTISIARHQIRSLKSQTQHSKEGEGK